MRLPRILFIFFSLLNLPATFAATDYSNLTGYEIEVIIFENVGKNDAGSEVWPDLIETDQVLNPIHLKIEPTGNEPGKSDPGYYYTLIPDEHKHLMDEVKRLRKSDKYRVLKHIAWIQPGLDEEHAEPIYVSSEDIADEHIEQLVTPIDTSNTAGNTDGTAANLIQLNNDPVSQPELSGSVKVVLGRFLHIYFDLSFRRNLTPIGGVITDGENAYHDIRTYPVQIYRRMRSKEVHYIDHPVIGVLVLATPYEPPVPNNKDVTTSPVLIQLDELPRLQH